MLENRLKIKILICLNEPAENRRKVDALLASAILEATAWAI